MTGTYAGQVNNPKVLKSLIVWNHSLLVVLPCGDVCVLSIVKGNLLWHFSPASIFRIVSSGVCTPTYYLYTPDPCSL